MTDISKISNGTVSYNIKDAEARSGLNGKLDGFTLRFAGNWTGGVHAVNFVTIDYSECNSENGVFIKFSMVNSHGNGQAGKFLQDVVLNVKYTGEVAGTLYRYFAVPIDQASSEYYGSHYYGDVFWVNDTTNKIVKFYVLMHQYSYTSQSPYFRLNASTKGVIAQSTGGAYKEEYSSGTRVWTTVNWFETDQTYSATSAKPQSGLAVASAISTKQDAISDLATIRSGAAAGATALQQSDVASTYSATGTTPVNGKAVASAISGKVDNSELANYVPTSRTINGKALTANITLSASDVSALPNSTVIPTITDTYLATSSNGMSGKAVANAISGKVNSSDLATVATSGSYNDLSNKPTIPTVNNSTITIQKNSTTVDSFTTNASSGKTINITVPTNTNELTNGAGFITSSSLPGVATTSTAGLVKPDGMTITVDANGTISSASSVDIDEETITENSDNKLQVVAVKNKRDDSTLPIWHGTEYQWNHGAPTTWYYWQTNVQAMWTSGGALPSSVYWYITAGENSLVAVTSSEISTNAAYSTDGGATWQGATLPSSASWHNIAYGDGRFVTTIYNYSNSVAYSTDGGATWQGATLPSSASWRNITYIGGKFVTYPSITTNKLAYSTDGGATWQGATLPSSATWNDLSYGNDTFIIRSGNNIAYSKDGCATWQSVTLPALPSNTYWRGPIYADDKFVIVSYGSNQVACSTDGVNWTESTLPSSAKWLKPIYADGNFVTVGYDSTQAACSTDGVNWTESTLPTSAYWGGLSYVDGNFVIIGSSSNKLAYSTDGGATWQGVTLPFDCGIAAHGDNKFVIIGRDSTQSSVYSTDGGATWQSATLPSSDKWVSLIHYNGKFIAVSEYSGQSAIFSATYDKCYTNTANPTTTSVVYSAPETTSSYTISSVTSGAITLSNNNTYYYNQSGNAFTYRTIGDAHPEYLCFIDGKGVKMGNNWIATNNSNNS